jgi:hypothetical protein
MPYLSILGQILDRSFNILINGQYKTEKAMAVFHYVGINAFVLD